jgi:hypothetical protein
MLKGHRLFEWGSGKGCLRPMPIDSMLFFLTFFNIRKSLFECAINYQFFNFIFISVVRLLTSVLLVTDAGAGNWIARSFM